MTPDPVQVVVDHPAPMAIRWGRGHGLGLFAVRARTPVEIPGVDPRDLAVPEGRCAGVPDAARIHGRRLWAPVEAIGPGGLGRRAIALDEALHHLARPREPLRATGEGLVGLRGAPFESPFPWSLHHARAIQDNGEVPAAAAGLVEPAVAAAARSVAAHAAGHLIHDGVRLYERLPLPLFNPTDPGRPNAAPMIGLHPPLLLPSRVAPDGRLPDGFRLHEALMPAVRALDGYLAQLDADGADVDRFLSSAPGTLVAGLRAMRPGDGEGAREGDDLQERLWPLVVAAARGEPPGEGREVAAGAIHAAAMALLRARGDGRLRGPGATTFGSGALNRSRLFVEAVVRPSLAGSVDPADAADLSALAP